jgi:hypothetical protein
MKKLIVGLAGALLACTSTVAEPPSSPDAAQTPPQPTAPAPDAPPADNGLNDLAAMTFGCPKAALNAAAREAAKAPSEGTYQFAYFGVLSDSHHAAYEVHFKSNYQSEPLLKYCVAIYCQQGWDPRTTKTEVSLMPATNDAAGKKAPVGHCDHKPELAAHKAD